MGANGESLRHTSTATAAAPAAWPLGSVFQPLPNVARSLTLARRKGVGKALADLRRQQEHARRPRRQQRQ